MRNVRMIEIWVGVFVAGGIAALFMLAMQVSNLNAALQEDGYHVTARFENISGLKERSQVTMAGVTIGRVTDIAFDPRSFEAVVTMEISKKYDHIPADTSAGVYTAGLLGEKYVGLEPGGAEENLKDGDEIQLTQSALVLEQLIGQFLFSKTTEGDK